MHGVDRGKGAVDFSRTSVDLVREVIGEAEKSCSYVKGYFPESITETHEKTKYAIVSLDCDLYEPTKAGLDFFYPRMTSGGILLLHDYSSTRWDGVKLAIDEFSKKTGELVVLLPDKSGSAFIRKSRA